MKMIGRYLTLAFLSALTAEFLLGDQWLSGGRINATTQIIELVLYAAFYGSAAVLIRELARRTGHGWPSILLLALAFGLLEEGIVDESLFNPHFAGAHLLQFGFIPALGIAGPWTIFVLSLHVIWSIGSPIAVLESLFPTPLARRAVVQPQLQAPWLRVPAIIVASALFLFAGIAVFEASAGAHFTASPAQLAASAVGVVALVVVALLLPKRRPRGIRPFGPAAAIAIAVTSVYIVLDIVSASLSPWLVVVLAVAVLALGAVLAAVLRLDVLGLAAGAILSYSWWGLSKALPLGVAPAIEQSVVVLVVLAAVVLAVRRRRAANSLAAPTVAMH
ncbi:MAG TPA: hypothetical protein VGF80_01085 [Galbitalea sp.]